MIQYAVIASKGMVKLLRVTAVFPQGQSIQCPVSNQFSLVFLKFLILKC